MKTSAIDDRPLSNFAREIPALWLFAAFLRLGIKAFGGPAMVATFGIFLYPQIGGYQRNPLRTEPQSRFLFCGPATILNVMQS